VNGVRRTRAGAARARRTGRRACLALLAAGAGWLACGGDAEQARAPAAGDAATIPREPEHEPLAHARTDIVEGLRADAADRHHPSDGGGRAWLAEGGPAVAGGTGTWTLVYEAGPHGVAVGGTVMLQVSPFWGWSTPQTEVPEAPGYTTVETAAEGVTLESGTLDRQLLGIEVAGRTLRAGERIRIVYGAGPAGARADRFAERESRFWIAVDGDGDGVRDFVEDPPAVDVRPGPPAGLLLHLPATAQPGQEVALTVALVDAAGNAGVDFEGRVAFGEHADSVSLPRHVQIEAGDGGATRVPLRVEEEGIVRIRATAGEWTALSNPMRVSTRAPRILFGDLHGHSGYSDGTGLPEDYFAYARDVAGLDFAALTDHDHWGIPFLDRRPDLYEAIGETARRFHAPGRFVTVPGYEWTSWLYGHRHVLYFREGGGPLRSSFDEAYDTPGELWEALRPHPALTFAHHPAGGPIATDWTVAPDPELEPVVEIASVHGSSEAPDGPGVIYAPVRGNFVRDALDYGYRLGFVGSGDGHDGHPGLAHLQGGSGGLAAVLAEDLSRAAILEALRARRSYATNGARIVLGVRLAGAIMGSTLRAAELPAESTLFVDVVATAPVERVDVIRSGRVLASAEGEARSSMTLGYPVRDLAPGEYVYVRVVQEDGGAAWSSPFFVE